MCLLLISTKVLGIDSAVGYPRYDCFPALYHMPQEVQHPTFPVFPSFASEYGELTKASTGIIKIQEPGSHRIHVKA